MVKRKANRVIGAAAARTLYSTKKNLSTDPCINLIPKVRFYISSVVLRKFQEWLISNVDRKIKHITPAFTYVAFHLVYINKCKNRYNILSDTSISNVKFKTLIHISNWISFLFLLNFILIIRCALHIGCPYIKSK